MNIQPRLAVATATALVLALLSAHPSHPPALAQGIPGGGGGSPTANGDDLRTLRVTIVDEESAVVAGAGVRLTRDSNDDTTVVALGTTDAEGRVDLILDGEYDAAKLSQQDAIASSEQPNWKSIIEQSYLIEAFHDPSNGVLSTQRPPSTGYAGQIVSVNYIDYSTFAAEFPDPARRQEIEEEVVGDRIDEYTLELIVSPWKEAETSELVPTMRDESRSAIGSPKSRGKLSTQSSLMPCGPKPLDTHRLLFTIGDLVWNDVNHDGLPQDIEPRIPGVTVRLYDERRVFVAACTSNQDGSYHFDRTGWSNRAYYLKFDPVNGKSFTVQNSVERGSHVDPVTGKTPVIHMNIFSGDTKNEHNWNAGYWVAHCEGPMEMNTPEQRYQDMMPVPLDTLHTLMGDSVKATYTIADGRQFAFGGEIRDVGGTGLGVSFKKYTKTIASTGMTVPKAGAPRSAMSWQYSMQIPVTRVDRVYRCSLGDGVWLEKPVSVAYPRSGIQIVSADPIANDVNNGRHTADFAENHGRLRLHGVEANFTWARTSGMEYGISWRSEHKPIATLTGSLSFSKDRTVSIGYAVTSTAVDKFDEVFFYSIVPHPESATGWSANPDQSPPYHVGYLPKYPSAFYCSYEGDNNDFGVNSWTYHDLNSHPRLKVGTEATVRPYVTVKDRAHWTMVRPFDESCQCATLVTRGWSEMYYEMHRNAQGQQVPADLKMDRSWLVNSHGDNSISRMVGIDTLTQTFSGHPQTPGLGNHESGETYDEWSQDDFASWNIEDVQDMSSLNNYVFNNVGLNSAGPLTHRAETLEGIQVVFGQANYHVRRPGLGGITIAQDIKDWVFVDKDVQTHEPTGITLKWDASVTCQPNCGQSTVVSQQKTCDLTN